MIRSIWKRNKTYMQKMNEPILDVENGMCFRRRLPQGCKSASLSWWSLLRFNFHSSFRRQHATRIVPFTCSSNGKRNQERLFPILHYNNFKTYCSFIASIISKKAAEKLDTLILDVKVGKGAFLKDETKARELANKMVCILKSVYLTASKEVAYLKQLTFHRRLISPF